MRAFPIVAVLGVLGTPAVLTDGSDAATPQQADFEWRGQIAADKAIEVKGVNGNIRAMAVGGRNVEVTAAKHEGRRGDPEDVTFEVVEHDDGVTICAVYPSRRSDEPNECAPGRGGRMNVRDNDTKVEFTVRVPEGVHLVARTVNGDVETERIGANVLAHTVNGSVTVSATGHAEAHTVNGSIRASLGRADWQGDLEFTTVNGTITVELPDGVGADVTASTVNGSIETDFPLTVRGRFGPKRLSGTIGDGGRELHLETVNGSIRLRRGR